MKDNNRKKGQVVPLFNRMGILCQKSLDKGILVIKN